jgi:hypothetical protein
MEYSRSDAFDDIEFSEFHDKLEEGLVAESLAFGVHDDA